MKGRVGMLEILVLWCYCNVGHYRGITERDITQQSHDRGRNHKHEANIAQQQRHCLGGSTHKQSNLGFRTDSFREMFFLEAGWKHQLMKKEGKRKGKERKGKEDRWIWINKWNPMWYLSLDELLNLIGYYRVTSGGIVGRTFFMMAWIQLRRIPEVIADRVHAPSLL